MTDWSSTAERIYHAVRADALAGRLPRGERIDPAALARRHGVSGTPIREALHRLVGEGLIEAHPHHGFSMPALTERDLRALYDWNCQTLLGALRLSTHAQRLAVPVAAGLLPDDDDIAAATERVFLAFARRSANAMIVATLERANAFLWAPRRVEPCILPQMRAELAGLCAALDERHEAIEPELALINYHRRRRHLAPELIELLAAIPPDALVAGVAAIGEANAHDPAHARSAASSITIDVPRRDS